MKLFSHGRFFDENDRLAGKGTSTPCHCEERSDVAIRSLFCDRYGNRT